MPRVKVGGAEECREVEYAECRWKRLYEMRKAAVPALELLEKAGISSTVIGSLARGDVGDKSDIDIVIRELFPSFAILNALSEMDGGLVSSKIVKATPNATPKGLLDYGSGLSVKFPLEPFIQRELDFFAFSGCLGLSGIRKNIRVPGVNKALVLIKPTPAGHEEFSILGREGEAARILEVSTDIIFERTRVLRRRDDVGRTGVYLETEVDPDSGFEGTWQNLRDRDPALRHARK